MLALLAVLAAIAPSAARAAPAAAAAASSRYVPFGPVRLVDSRLGPQPALLGPVGEGAWVPIQVAGQAGLPATGVTAVVVNLTAVNTTAAGYVQAAPTGQAVAGTSSSLNIDAAGEIRAGATVVPVGDSGRISVYTQHRSDLIVDVFGYFTPASSSTSGRYVGVTPARLLDSRSGVGQGAPGRFVAGDVRRVQAAGRGGLPATGVAAVVVNLTVTQPEQGGFVTAGASEASMPATSNLNVERAFQTRANLAVVPVAADGSFALATSMATHVLADVVGYLTDTTAPLDSAGLFVPLTPARLLDTRGGVGAPTGLVTAGGSVVVAAAGRGGLPATGVAAIAGTITATQALGAGFVTAWPGGSSPDATSTVNLEGPYATVANAAFTALSTAGTFSVFTQSGAHLLADVTGYFLAAPQQVTPADLDIAAYWGYLYGDGHLDPATGRWTWSQEPYVLPESTERFLRGAALVGVKVAAKANGGYETLTQPHPPMPDYRGRPDAEVAAFLSAVVEGEGDACSGLLDDDPDQAHVQYVADLVAQLGVAYRLQADRSGTLWELYARQASWPIVQRWPYATPIRTPGVGTLICT